MTVSGRWPSGLAAVMSSGLLVCQLAAGSVQDLGGQQDTTAIFICGEDEKIPEIPLHWTTIVLAGDGRLYTPCPSGNHGAEHREAREASVIGEGRYQPYLELRWRAAQAISRNSTRAEVFPVVGGGNAQKAGSLEFLLAQVNGLGGFITGTTEQPLCSSAVQVFDGTTDPLRWQPGRLIFMLGEIKALVGRSRDPMPPMPLSSVGLGVPVAKEGAYAIGVHLSRPGLNANVVRAATNDLRACFNFAGAGEVASLILEDLGLARYEKDAEITDTENFLVQESFGTVLKTLGAVKGLEALLRQNPQHQIGETARFRLRQLVAYGVRNVDPAALDADGRIRRLALMALQAAHDVDASTLRAAAGDGDWQVRRLAAGSLTLSDPQMAAIGELLAADSAFQVRYEMLSALSRLAGQTHQCAPIVERFSDPSPMVAMRAMDVLPATCTDLDAITAKLIDLAGRLETGTDDGNWHLHSRALTTLARIKPAAARPLMAAAVKNAVWQVRAAAAAASVALADDAFATRLARDPEPNVQTAALDALFRLRSAAVVPRAIDALKNWRRLSTPQDGGARPERPSRAVKGRRVGRAPDCASQTHRRGDRHVARSSRRDP